ncbi:MAG TPA: acyltransferase family protein [Acidimicrobiales bacterium]|nr:acyltransferase family protein [Acidimicrobiales bacterium]
MAPAQVRQHESLADQLARRGRGPVRFTREYRADIDGLRAVAILAVVLYHAHVGALSGGYVGVDLFYVISGYLITDLLWRELAVHGRVSFKAFYGRRMRRLLPAAILVIAVTVAASVAFLPPLEIRSVWKDGVACALYIGNYRFALLQTNYLTASGPVSPFQHFWSLGVEEQFYAIWPLLLVVGAVGVRGIRGKGWPSRPRALGWLAVVVVVSFVLSLWLTHANEPWAFFSLPARAWELGIGGLIALAAPALRRVNANWGAGLGWVGLAVIGWSVVALDAQTPFPGVAALAPVLGAGAVIAGGLSAGAVGPVAVLGRSGPRVIGRISYSWYLWHWPVLIIVPVAVGHALAEWEYLALAAGSGLVAAASYRWVEAPARSSPWLARRPSRSLLAGASLSAVGICVCLVAAGAAPPVTGHGRAPVADIHTPGAAGPGVGPGGSSGPGGSGGAGGSGRSGRGTTRPNVHIDALQRQLRAEEAQVQTAIRRSAARRTVPSNLQPPLADASGSEPEPMVDGCLLSVTSTSGPSCRFGDTASSKTVVLFGDSHAAMWFPAVDAWATSHHYGLDVRTMATCPPADVSFFSPVLGRTFTECSQWRAGVVSEIRSTHPAVVVLGTAPNYDSAYHIVQDGPAWLAGLRRLISSIKAAGSKVVVLGPIPSPDQVVADCVSAHLSDVGACNVPRGYHRDGIGLYGYDVKGMAAEAKAVRAAGARWVDVAPWMCDRHTCPVVIDNLLVYRDNSHLTVPFATYLAPLVSNELSQALGRRS